jgi:hypothetical protein
VLLLLVMLLKPEGLLGDFEFPFLRQLIPPLAPTARSRMTNEGEGRPLTADLQTPLDANPTTPNESLPPQEAQ